MWIQLLLLISLVAFDAMGDATRDDKKKISHLFQSLFVAIALLLIIYYQGVTWKDHMLILILWYAVNRLFLFDLIWNLTKGNIPLDFIGGTGWWDITISKILIRIKMPLFFWFWIKFIIWITYNGAIISKYRL